MASLFSKYPRTIVAVISLILLIAIDTLSARLIPDQGSCRESSLFYQHGFEKNCKGFQKWGAKGYTFYTNSLGFKDSACRDIPLNSSRYRIIFLGDSFTEGIGFSYEQTFVGLLDERLRNQDVEILNAAVISYSPKLYYLKLLHLIDIGLKIDELFVLVDISDIQDEIVYQEYRPGSPPPLAEKVKSWLRKHFMSFRLIEPLGIIPIDQICGLVEKDDPKITISINDPLYFVERDRWDFDENVYEKWGKDGVNFAIENMTRLLELCKNHKIKLTIAIYPWPGMIPRLDLPSKYVSVWTSFASEHNIPFINLIPYFTETTPANAVVKKFYIDGDCHFNEEGHRLIADVLFKQIGSGIK
jgi:lysophospholipase L1-like esterase